MYIYILNSMTCARPTSVLIYQYQINTFDVCTHFTTYFLILPNLSQTKLLLHLPLPITLATFSYFYQRTIFDLSVFPYIKHFEQFIINRHPFLNLILIHIYIYIYIYSFQIQQNLPRRHMTG